MTNKNRYDLISAETDTISKYLCQVKAMYELGINFNSTLGEGYIVWDGTSTRPSIKAIGWMKILKRINPNIKLRYGILYDGDDIQEDENGNWKVIRANKSVISPKGEIIGYFAILSNGDEECNLYKSKIDVYKHVLITNPSNKNYAYKNNIPLITFQKNLLEMDDKKVIDSFNKLNKTTWNLWTNQMVDNHIIREIVKIASKKGWFASNNSDISKALIIDGNSDLVLNENKEIISTMYSKTEPTENVSKTPQIEAKVVEPNKLPTLNTKDIKISEDLLTGNVLCPNIVFEESEHLYINSMTGEKYTCVSDFLGKKDLSHIPNIELYAQQGKDMHNALHTFFLNPKEFDLDTVKENQLKHTKFGVINALNELNTYKPTIIASELIVADDKNMLCGTIDLIFSYEVGGETIYVIADFKSSWHDKEQRDNYMNQLYTYKQLLKNSQLFLPFGRLSRQKLKLMIIVCINEKQLGSKILPINLLDKLKENYIINIDKLVNNAEENINWEPLEGEINE